MVTFAWLNLLFLQAKADFTFFVHWSGQAK